MNGVRALQLVLLLGAALLAMVVCDAQGGEELPAERQNPRLKSRRSEESSGSSSGSWSSEESGKHGAEESPTPTASDSLSEVSKAPAPETSPKP
ncbi:hypothetical protein IscW_ISCW021871 [Ixodes scapularis]|uniref:Secreted protein n=1 Tax=Ixodes scapularis TaxID=6945 RepID=B7Q7A4_IXOSC|nr:hypothetical protein IscW_ISCW021871 [Ixodes scapularis]|eukprot:XP_002412142.1 hypothetical protein IscW_ISCW021871 [Ixodes scapularis]